MSEKGLEKVKEEIYSRSLNLEEIIGVEKSLISSLGLSACIKAGRAPAWSSDYSYIHSVNGKTSIKLVLGLTPDANFKSFAFASKDYWIGNEDESLLLTEKIPFDNDDIRNLIKWLLEKI